MSYLVALGRAEVSTAVGLAVAGAVLAVTIAVQSLFEPAHIISSAATAGLVFLYTFSIGSIPAFFVGAPIYAALQHYWRNVNWVSATCVGILPGLLALNFQSDFAIWSMVAGAITSLVTHCCYELSSNHLIKRTATPPLI